MNDDKGLENYTMVGGGQCDQRRSACFGIKNFVVLHVCKSLILRQSLNCPSHFLVSRSFSLIIKILLYSYTVINSIIYTYVLAI